MDRKGERCLQESEGLVEDGLGVSDVVGNGQLRAREVRLKEQMCLRVRTLERLLVHRQRHLTRQLSAFILYSIGAFKTYYFKSHSLKYFWIGK